MPWFVFFGAQATVVWASNYFYEDVYDFVMILRNCATCPDGLVVMTFRLHRKGHRFDPGSGYILWV